MHVMHEVWIGRSNGLSGATMDLCFAQINHGWAIISAHIYTNDMQLGTRIAIKARATLLTVEHNLSCVWGVASKLPFHEKDWQLAHTKLRWGDQIILIRVWLEYSASGLKCQLLLPYPWIDLVLSLEQLVTHALWIAQPIVAEPWFANDNLWIIQICTVHITCTYA